MKIAPVVLAVTLIALPATSPLSPHAQYSPFPLARYSGSGPG
ncbi:MAG: hypothetical protein NTU53_13805 [Planctomycetota bacterium]|nr:hypothetical protein [Planctomycetota bacterium]